MNNDQQATKSWITDSAILIPVVTLASYFITLRYEAGMCSYFNIPIHFISLNPTLVMFRSAQFIYILFIFSLITLILYSASQYCSDNPGHYFPHINILSFLVFLSQIIYNTFFEIDRIVLFTAGIIAILVIIALVEHSIGSLTDKFYKIFMNPSIVLLFVGLFWFGSSLAYQMGKITIERQEEYHVFDVSSEGPKVVVLRINVISSLLLLLILRSK